MIPAPRLGIDRFADAAEQAERAEIMAGHIIVAFPHQRADRGRRGVEDVHPMLVDDLPEADVVGVIRYTLEHQGCRAILERAVDDLAVEIGRTHVWTPVTNSQPVC